MKKFNDFNIRKNNNYSANYQRAFRRKLTEGVIFDKKSKKWIVRVIGKHCIMSSLAAFIKQEDAIEFYNNYLKENNNTTH